MANSRPKRPKAPPPRLNLEEMEHDPSMRGMLSFLEISPAEKLEMLRRRAQVEAAENTETASVAVDLQTTVDAELQDSVAAEPADTITSQPTATVAPTAGDTVAVGSPLSIAPLWCAEGNAGVFPNSRARRILRAEDVLTRTEQAVYEILWNAGSAAAGERIASAGYDVLARQAGVTKMNAKHILERLIDKGFLQVESLPDTLRRIPTRYRVFSSAAALERMTRAGRTHVVRTGNGILFAHLLPATVVAGFTTTVGPESPEPVSTDPK